MTYPMSGVEPFTGAESIPGSWVEVPGRPGWYAPPEIVPIYAVTVTPPVEPEPEPLPVVPPEQQPQLAGAGVLSIPAIAAALAASGAPGWILAAVLGVASAYGLYKIPAVQEFLEKLLPWGEEQRQFQVTEYSRRILEQKTLSDQLALTERQVAMRGWEVSEAAQQRAFEKVQADMALRATAEALEIPYDELKTLNPAVPLSAAGLLALAPTIARQFAQKSHEQIIKCQVSTGAAIFANVLEGALPAALPLAFTLNPTLQQFAQGLAAKALETLYTPLENMAPITPEKAPGVGVNLLLQAVLMGTGAHLMSVTAEAAAPLKSMGLGYLAAFLADMAGFSRIAGAFQGMMIQWGLAQPMRYWALEKFRTMLPSERDLINLVGEYAITREQFNQAMPYHGYSQEWIDRLYHLSHRALSPMLFRYLGEAGLLDAELLDRELKHAQYSEETIPYLKEWLGRVSAGELKGAYGSTVLKAYRIGCLQEQELRDHLANLGYSEPQINRALYSARLDLTTQLVEDTKALFLDQYKAGNIDQGDLDLRLTVLNYRPEIRAIEIARATLKRKPKKEAKVDPKIEAEIRKLQAKYTQAYIQLFQMDKLTRNELAAAIQSTGVSSELADITATLEALKKQAETERKERQEEEKKAKEEALARTRTAKKAS